MKLFTLGITGTCSNNRGYFGAVPTPTDLKTSIRSKIGSLLVFLIFGLAMFMPSNMNAQTVVDIFNLPEAKRCVSNDLRVVEASLDFDLCGPVCEEGEVIEYPLTLAIFNNTGSERTSFAFFARLEQYNPDGTLANIYFITGCKGPVPPNTTTEITFNESLEILDENGEPTEFDGVPYLCGGSLKLVNLYQAWTDASDNDNRQCPLVAEDIAPKCDVLPSIEIQTPIGAFVEDTTDVSCFGANDGAINITVNGGTPAYTYLWSNGATTQDLTGIAAGTYSVTITDSNGCTDTLEGIQIGEPDELEGTVDTASDVSCNGFSDGAIDISVIGGTPAYTYLWSNGATTQDLTGIAAGTYSVTITDSKGCTDTLDGIQIGEPDELEGTVDATTDVSCNGYLDGSIDISVIGGTPAYTYLWSNGATTQDLTGIAAGTYSVTITDSNGCTDSLTGIQIGEPDELEGTVDSITDATCNGELDGSIDISVIGGTPAYTYLWSNGATTQDLTGISAGTYSVTITDSKGCTDTLDGIQIGEPDELEGTVDATTDVSCNGYLDGSIDISVIGGTPAYTYLWSNGATTQDLTGIAAGTYSVTITDSNGCTDSLTGIQIGEPDELEGTVDSITDATCNGELDGSIDISVIGGTPAYTYLWSNGATTQDLTGISAGTYSVTITDSKGCTDTLDGIQIGEPDELEGTVDATTDVSCKGYSDGSIDISVIGGTPAYTYLWSNGATTQDLTGIAAGTYSVTITDSKGCADTLDGIQIGEPDKLEGAVDSITDATCNGELDGSIDISVIGGTPAYTYLWSNGATTQDLTGISAGTYSVTITDSKGCTDTIEGIEVDDPSTLEGTVDATTDVSCNGYSDGSIDISVIGGTPAYTYLWSNGATTQDLTGISAGTYSVTITDSKGCTDTLDGIQIGEPDLLDVQVNIQDVSCPGFNDGKITFTASGGAPPYSSEYGIFENGILILSNLPPGDYGIVVTDDNGCGLAIDGIPVGEPEEIVIPEIQITQADCLGGDGGFIFLGNPQDLYISFDDGDTFTLYTGSISLPVGTYNAIVKFGVDGCASNDFQIIIDRPQGVDVILETSSIDPDCETLLGSIAVANPQDLFFTVSNQITKVVYYNKVEYPIGGFVNLPSGNYLVKGESSDGCRLGSKIVVLAEPICDGFEGCTLGYWKNHTDRWACYSTCTLYGSIFTNAPSQLSGLTLLEVLNLGGGGINNLGRQSVAALLNTCHADVNYEILSTEELIAYVMANFNNAGAAGSYLDNLNNAGCTLGGSSATTAPSSTCPSTGDTKPGKGKPGKNSDAAFTASFSAYPVPFRETLNIKYEFDYRSDVSIQFFDMQGRLLSTYKAKKVSKGDVTNLNLDFATRASQVYIVKVNTDRDVFTKNIISDK